MSPDAQSPFAAGLHMTADSLEKDAAYLRKQAEGVQEEWDRHGDVVERVERLEHVKRLERERDEARAEVARMRPVVEAAEAWVDGDSASESHLNDAVYAFREGGGS